MHSVLVSGDYFPPDVGGIATMMSEVAANLGPSRVAVITGVQNPGAPPPVDSAPRVYRINGALRPTSTLGTIELFARVAQIVVRERPDVMQYATLEDAHIAYFTHRLLRKPHVFFTHGNEVLALQRSAWPKPREALLASARVVAVSRFTEELVRSIGVPPERIRLVHPGCDTATFVPRTVTAETRACLTQGRRHRHVVLTVGNLVERKGHDTVIRALARMPVELADVLYVIAGAGSYRRTLEELAQSLGVADQVVFLGRVPTEQLPLLYSLADLFVMVSRERLDMCDVEGFGIVFIEAAACGTPAIGGRSGGVEDAIVDNETGVLVDPLDPAALAATMAALLRDEPRRRRLGDAARQRAATFTWANFTRAVAGILEEVAAE